MTKTKIQFGELPGRGSTNPNGRAGGGKHRKIADALRTAPGQWALIDKRPSLSAASCMANQIRTGYYKAYPKGTFEAAARTVDGERQVWARYIGEDGEHA